MDMEKELEEIVRDMCLKMEWGFDENRTEMRFFINDMLNTIRANYSNKLRGSYLKGYDHGTIDGRLSGEPV